MTPYKIKLVQWDDDPEVFTDVFNKSKGLLLLSLKNAIKNGLHITKGSQIYGEDNLFFIRMICHYADYTVYWLSVFETNEQLANFHKRNPPYLH